MECLGYANCPHQGPPRGGSLHHTSDTHQVLVEGIPRVAELATGVSWPRLRQELRSLQVTEVNVDQHGFLQRSEPSEACLEFLSKLEAELPSKVLGTWPLEEASAAS